MTSDKSNASVCDNFDNRIIVIVEHNRYNITVEKL